MNISAVGEAGAEDSAGTRGATSGAGASGGGDEVETRGGGEPADRGEEAAAEPEAATEAGNQTGTGTGTGTGQGDAVRSGVEAEAAAGADGTTPSGDSGAVAKSAEAGDGPRSSQADEAAGGGGPGGSRQDPVGMVPGPGGRAAAGRPGGRSGRGGGARRGVPAVPASLSPSRASDFMQCPLLYRFRVIDRLPEKPSAAATRGTLVHAVLERLFDAPAAQRTARRAKSLIPGQWERLRQQRPELADLFADADEEQAGTSMARWLGEAEQLVERWFTLEDPTRLEPAERELFVETELDSGLRLRGIIDRVDVAPTGEVRIVDYKTGKAPRPEYAQGAQFQMTFYALVVWRLKGVVPRRLQLVYLGSGDVLTYDPVQADLEAVERKLHALWDAIRLATETGDWRPRPTKLCGWCDHQAVCPEFGGTPPPYPLTLPLGAADPGTAEQGRMGDH